jgi:hypothetical protein
MALLCAYALAAVIAFYVTALLFRKRHRPAKPFFRGLLFAGVTLFLGAVTFLPMSAYLHFRGRNFPGGHVPFQDSTKMWSIMGYYRGNAQFVTAPPRHKAQTKALTWLASIEGHGHWSEEITVRPGARGPDPFFVAGVVRIPDEPALVGSQVSGTLEATITYPAPGAPVGFVNESTALAFPVLFEVRNRSFLDRTIYAAERRWSLILVLAGVGLVAAVRAWEG